jgi:ATP synthase protein I
MTAKAPENPPPPPPRGDRMRDSVVRFEKRRRRWAAEAGRTLVVAVAVAGVGWLVVIPAVAGFGLGHWLDSRYGTGIVAAAGLGLFGLALGCWSAWRRIGRQREEHHGRGR